MVEATARHYLKDGDEVDDAAQDVMAKLWVMHEQLRPRPDALARTVTRNLCLNRLRDSKSVASTVPLAELADVPDDGDEHGQVEQMMHIIHSLPTAQQAILHMRHVEERSMEEIAATLGCTEVAVRKALSRARMAVRNIYMKQRDP